MPLDQFARVIHINLIGTFNVIRLAAAAMQNNQPQPSGERGVIVNSAFVAAYDGQIVLAVFSSSKGVYVSMKSHNSRMLSLLYLCVMNIDTVSDFQLHQEWNVV